jgi:hypothetical protein
MRSSGLGPILWLLAGFAAVLPGCAGGRSPAGETEKGLTGLLTRQEIEAAEPSWVEAQVRAEPDYEAAADLPAAIEGAEITVFLGTWCSDSRRELARFWSALDGVGLELPAQVHYVGVDRSKKRPEELVAGNDLLYVPTFVVRRGGHEVGRIVETSPGGIERDLLALLSGERQGLVTAKAELLGQAAQGGEKQ